MKLVSNVAILLGLATLSNTYGNGDDCDRCPPEMHKCLEPRPTLRHCPQPQFIRSPDLKICGVTRHGEFISFFQECDACRNNGIVYFFNKPCRDIDRSVICEEDEIFINGRCHIDNNSCANVQCANGYICRRGRCESRCQ